MSREFNFEAFSSLSLIIISIERELNDWCHLLYLQINIFFDILKMFFFGTFIKHWLQGVKEFHGLDDDVKITLKNI